MFSSLESCRGSNLTKQKCKKNKRKKIVKMKTSRAMTQKYCLSVVTDEEKKIVFESFENKSARKIVVSIKKVFSLSSLLKFCALDSFCRYNFSRFWP